MRRAVAVLTLSSAIALAACSTLTQDEAARIAAAAATITCRDEKPVGSHRSKRVCRTQEQWKYANELSLRAYDKVIRRSAEPRR